MKLRAALAALAFTALAIFGAAPPASAQTTMQTAQGTLGAQAAANACTSASCVTLQNLNGQSTCWADISGNFTETLFGEIQGASGNWYQVPVVSWANGSGTTVTQITAAALISFPAGPGGCRVRVNASTTGSAGVFLYASNANAPVGQTGGGGASGSVTSAGTNGTVAQDVQGINGGVPLNTYQSSQNATGGPYTANGTYSVTTGGTLNVCSIVTNSGWAGGSIQVLLSNNNGTTYSGASFTATTGGVGTAITLPGDYVVPVGGQTNLEIIITGYSTGSAYIYCDVANTGPAANSQTVNGTVSITYANNQCLTGTLVNLAVSTASAATTQLRALSGSTVIYVCKVVLIAGGTTSVTLEYGTGTLCATGLTTLTGAIPLAAQAGWVEAPGSFPSYATAAGNALCLVNSAAQQVSGSITVVQQ